MHNRYTVRETQATHFVTSTVVEWLPIFTDILVDSFQYCREHKGLFIPAWVIMDNHFHAIVAGPNLSATLGDLKKHTAKKLIAQLTLERHEWLRKDRTSTVRPISTAATTKPGRKAATRSASGRFEPVAFCPGSLRGLVNCHDAPV